MPDLYHEIGSDLMGSANGDLLLADGVDLSNQFVLRRLLTNAGDYIWQPNYGAGIPRLVGEPIDVPTTKSLIQSQMFLESSVVQSPAPAITVTPIANGMFASISYVESDTLETNTLKFNATDTQNNG